MAARVILTAPEARVIGCLMEKQVTTPDQYPLSVNALVNACNQKSNRDPVMALGEAEVQQLIDVLVRKRVVIERSGFGSRVPKYQHCYCNTEFSPLKFTPQEFAIVCELLLRGPQTPGELRSRAARMASFADSAEVEAALEALATRADGAVVEKLPRQPGRRESRYAQLLTGPVDASLLEVAASAADEAAAPPSTALEERLARIEAELARLQSELVALRDGRATDA